MITRREYHNMTWVDLESPTRDEVIQVMGEYDIHPIIGNELLTPSLRPKVEHFENCLYLILHFPALRHSHEGNGGQEVDFVIGKKFMITVHYEAIDPIHKFSKVFEVNSILERDEIGGHAGFLFFHLVRKLYGALQHELGYIGDLLKDREAKIFGGQESTMVREMSLINRDLINFRQGIRLHQSVIESLEIVGKEFFGKAFEPYLRNLTGEYHKVNEVLQDLRDTLHELRSTNDSLLSAKTTETMRTLTIISFIMLSANMFAQVFIIPAEHSPIIGHSLDFWILLGGTLISGALPYFYFKYKKWI